MSLRIHRLSYALGAEITGIDTWKPLDDQSFSTIHSAFLEHSILLFRGQPLTREQHIAFSRRFGELDRNIAAGRDSPPGYPEILLNKPEPSSKPIEHVGDYWHSDRSNTRVPAMASLLRGIEIPEVGGDTMFSNLYLAYVTLSNGMKKLIEGLDGVHVGTARRTDSLPLAHPLVKVHPETGRKSLFLTDRIRQFAGMTTEESKPLIQFLLEHATRPQFVYRHRWRKDDLLIWDNRCTMHNALGDYDGTQIRHMERTTVMGTPSGYVYDGPLS